MPQNNNRVNELPSANGQELGLTPNVAPENPEPLLSDQHRALLEKESAISPDVIQQRGYRDVAANCVRKANAQGKAA